MDNAGIAGEAVDLLDLPIDDAVARIDFDAAGLVPVITQQLDSGRVLMLAWMNAEALRSTIETRRGTYYSRSRDRQWVKGETSGHVQKVVGLQLDCDGDALLMLVEQVGPACHTGAESCFDTGGDR
ncbi:MAG: phosphoribosyl-AMP cyclohydrolase [Actinomycetota bacterium]|nr:phosphoribosyl-AMP cyclohydrolase [Actinomycetota bacterium]